MIPGFGPVRQIGFVVPDLDEAVRHWVERAGVGPFFLLHDIRFGDYRYRGEAVASPLCSFALAQWGEMQLELIEQHDEAPSAYRDFLAAGGRGVQHLSSRLEHSGDYEAARARGIACGLAVVHESRSPDGRFCYLDTGTPDVPMIELAEALIPAARRLSERIADAARGWDGTDPVRLLRPRRS